MTEDLNLDAIQARAADATCGPWYVVGTPWNHDTPYVIAGHADPHFGTFVADMLSISDDPANPKANRVANAEFIAHARQDVPMLLAAIERVRAEHTHGKQFNICRECGVSWPCPTIAALDLPEPPS